MANCFERGGGGRVGREMGTTTRESMPPLGLKTFCLLNPGSTTDARRRPNNGGGGAARNSSAGRVRSLGH